MNRKQWFLGLIFSLTLGHTSYACSFCTSKGPSQPRFIPQDVNASGPTTGNSGLVVEPPMAKPVETFSADFFKDPQKTNRQPAETRKMGVVTGIYQ